MICTFETRPNGAKRLNWIHRTTGMDEYGRWACWLYSNADGKGKAIIWQIELGAAL